MEIKLGETYFIWDWKKKDYSGCGEVVRVYRFIDDNPQEEHQLAKQIIYDVDFGDKIEKGFTKEAFKLKEDKS